MGILIIRFDVSGLHPKSKTPGTLTQVAYDKNSINDIVSLVILVQIEKIVLPGEPCRLLK